MSAKPAQTGFRVELLSAMETFALGHEIGHCFIEERNPGKSPSKDDETFCDKYALLISRALGSRLDNYSMAIGAGAYTFLRAAAVSLGSSRTAETSSHPNPRDRADAVLLHSVEGLSPARRAQVRRYLKEIGALFAEIERHCQMVQPSRKS
jgi:hypothetical protein